MHSEHKLLSISRVCEVGMSRLRVEDIRKQSSAKVEGEGKAVIYLFRHSPLHEIDYVPDELQINKDWD